MAQTVSYDPQRQRRSLEDAHRSLARFMSVVLPGFFIFKAGHEVENIRPSCVVRALSGRQRTGPFHTSSITQPMACYVYPEVGDDIRIAETDARTLQFQVEQAFEFGIDGLSGSMRVPMWDWSNVGQDDLIPPDDDLILDYYRLDTFNSEALPDTDDLRRWSIAVTMRLAWSRHNGVKSSTPAEDVGVGISPGQPVH